MEIVDKIVKYLEKSKFGLTITDLVEVSGLSRSSIRTGLAKLEGAKKVKIRSIGMAKIYSIVGAKK